MKLLTKYIKPVGLALAAGASLSAASMASAQPEFAEEQPQAQPLITNIAQAEWDVGGQRLQMPSNRIDIQVVPPPNTPPEITIYHFNKPPGADQIPIPGTICRGSGGDIPVELAGVFAGTNTNPASVTETGRIRAGEPLIISILAPNKNLDPTAIDSFDIVLTTPAGDREIINIVETEVNSGRFVGMIKHRSDPANTGSGRLRPIGKPRRYAGHRY